eukprot:SAG11_NODE_572_length_8445_cov_7.136353_6_plen_147_part_00
MWSAAADGAEEDIGQLGGSGDAHECHACSAVAEQGGQLESDSAGGSGGLVVAADDDGRRAAGGGRADGSWRGGDGRATWGVRLRHDGCLWLEEASRKGESQTMMSQNGGLLHEGEVEDAVVRVCWTKRKRMWWAWRFRWRRRLRSW